MEEVHIDLAADVEYLNHLAYDLNFMIEEWSCSADAEQVRQLLNAMDGVKSALKYIKQVENLEEM